jgi:hypothetical protein
MGLKDWLVKPSTRAFMREARRTPGYSFLDLVHAYIYARWTYLYIGIGVGEHPLAKWLARLIPRRKPREADSASIGFADGYHGKAIPLETARRLVTVNEPVRIPDLEQVIPYRRARSRACPWTSA